MPITLLKPRTANVQYVLPKRAGVEDRDLESFPLPPNANLALVEVVCQELRDQGHDARYEFKRERLADWDATRRHNQRDEDRGDTVLRFCAGGLDVIAYVDGRTVRLVPRDFRGGRAGMKFALLGRP